MSKKEKEEKKEETTSWEDVYKKVAKENREGIVATCSEHAGKVSASGLITAVVAWSIQEGLWHLLAPEARWGVWHIVSTIAAPIAGSNVGAIASAAVIDRKQAKKVATRLRESQTLLQIAGMTPQDIADYNSSCVDNLPEKALERIQEEVIEAAGEAALNIPFPKELLEVLEVLSDKDQMEVIKDYLLLQAHQQANQKPAKKTAKAQA